MKKNLTPLQINRNYKIFECPVEDLNNIDLLTVKQKTTRFLMLEWLKKSKASIDRMH